MRAATHVRQGRERSSQGLARESERGQVTVLFILILMTLILVAIVAISVGQVLVRRQQAQMVVDAAALAGAGSQARGLNTIAINNENSLTFLQMIQVSTLLPYVDSNSTTNERYFAALGGTYFVLPFTSDWAGDILKDYNDVFKLFNGFTDAANLAYSPASPLPFAPRGEANKVIEENFGDGSDRLFRDEDLAGSGVVIPANKLGDALQLVELTEPESYRIAPYYYAFYPLHWSLDTCSLPFPADLPCAHLFATYGSLLFYYTTIEPLVDPIEYDLGKFYDNEEGDDVRFCYYLKVSQAPVLFGKSFFDDIPAITVAAAAKPYGGYLGDTFEPAFEIPITVGPYGQQDGKQISATYAPKLVPLKTSEKLMLPILLGDFEDPLKWATILH